jgi:hypothetical protein
LKRVVLNCVYLARQRAGSMRVKKFAARSNGIFAVVDWLVTPFTLWGFTLQGWMLIALAIALVGIILAWRR